ncbi:SRPBCC family protein [Ornithinimicrobium sp. F0845]|uniref:SRPBCC family protein n=1 Tax=Ornithinimicrobium sp. F0845 TaxID=2926412 RepID=UPI001FF38020|nr:SRPBCC family protein [Ornithinimicrobium sp. F0845]MCK0112429.1 SRPBCC family protein [Ornithinimicrobium sp. F0845]
MTTTPTTPSPTGTRADHDGRTFVEFTRTFRAPIEDVWAAVTESDRLARWIGTWTGDPADGEVQFLMSFEEDATAERMVIDVCEAPRLLRLTSTVLTDDTEQQTWKFRIDLSEDAGVTTRLFSQDVPDATMAAGVGPGWDYYLDRLVAAESGVDPATVVWDDYYPALSEHYRAAFA